MNAYLQSLIIGIIEGLTEFLPVSSTAHIRITQDLLGISLESEYWQMYAIVIQLGAILAVFAYFSKRICGFLSTFPKGESGRGTWLTHPLSLTMLAFVVTAGPSYLLETTIGENLESLSIMGWSLIIGGAVMWIVDAAFRRPTTAHMDQMGFWQAIWVGATQTLAAAFPGTSRSMVTIAAGQTAGMSREAALEFSFFLSLPTMVAATGFKLFRTLQAGHVAMDQQQWQVLGVGFATSFVVALAVIAWFMHWVRKHGFVPFAIYRIVMGIAVLAWLAKR